MCRFELSINDALEAIISAMTLQAWYYTEREAERGLFRDFFNSYVEVLISSDALGCVVIFSEW